MGGERRGEDPINGGEERGRKGSRDEVRGAEKMRGRRRRKNEKNGERNEFRIIHNQIYLFHREHSALFC